MKLNFKKEGGMMIASYRKLEEDLDNLLYREEYEGSSIFRCSLKDFLSIYEKEGRKEGNLPQKNFKKKDI